MVTGSASSLLGVSVGRAGDINRDGFDDIIIGAPIAGGNKGVAYIIYGGPKSSMQNWDFGTDVLNPLATGFSITGEFLNDQLGSSVNIAGDPNKDGYNDIIVGAYGWSNSFGQGAAYVIYAREKASMMDFDFGSTTLDPLTTGFMIKGATTGDSLGYSISRAGDINNDGYDDIIIGAYARSSLKGVVYIIHTACSPCWNCPTNCNQCSDSSTCTDCTNPYRLYEYKCMTSCPASTFNSNDVCKDCPPYCTSCSSSKVCTACEAGYTLSHSICTVSALEADANALQAVFSAVQVIGRFVCVSRVTFSFTSLVSKIVQDTRYMNLSVTEELSDIYQTWDTNLISWEVPNLLSKFNHFETSPALFARYEIDSPYLVNFWPTLVNVAIGFGCFLAFYMFRKFFEQSQRAWAYSLLLKMMAGSWNFCLVELYGCLDVVLFYLVLDAKTNPFNTFFCWASFLFAIVFLALGCFLVFFNFWKVVKFQVVKGKSKDMENFNEKNKYWGLFYEDFSDEDVWSQGFLALQIIRNTIASLIIVVLYDYAMMQNVYLIISDGAVILFLYLKTPFATLRGRLMQYYFEIITLLVHLCTFALSTTDSPSDKFQDFFSTTVIYLNKALIGGSFGFMLIELYKTIVQKIEEAKMKKSRSISTQTGPPPPEGILETQSQNLKMGQGQQFKVRTRNRQESWVKNHEQSISFEHFQLLPVASEGGLQQQNNNNISGNMESSQVLDSNFNIDTSFQLEVPTRKRVNQQRNQRSVTPVGIQHQPQNVRQRERKDNSVMKNQILNVKQFEHT